MSSTSRTDTAALISNIQTEIDEINWTFRRSEQRFVKFEEERRKSLIRMSASQTRLSMNKTRKSVADEKEEQKIKGVLKKYDHLHRRHDNENDAAVEQKKMSTALRGLLMNAGELKPEQIQKVFEAGKGHLLPTHIIMQHLDEDAVKSSFKFDDAELDQYLKPIGTKRASAVDVEQMKRLEDSSGAPVKRVSILDNDPEELARRAAILVAKKKQEKLHLLRKLLVVGNSIAAWYRAAEMWRTKSRRAAQLEKQFDAARDLLLTQRTNEVIVIKEPWRAYELGMAGPDSSRTGGTSATAMPANRMGSRGSFKNNNSDDRNGGLDGDGDSDSDLDDPEIARVEEVLHTDASTAYPFSEPNSQVHLTMTDIRPVLEVAYSPFMKNPRPKSPAKVIIPLLNLSTVTETQAAAAKSVRNVVSFPPPPASAGASSSSSSTAVVPGTPANASTLRASATAGKMSPGRDAAAPESPGKRESESIEPKKRGLPKVGKIVTVSARSRVDVTKDLQKINKMRPDVVSRIAYIDKRTPEGILLVERVNRELQKGRRGSYKEVDPFSVLDSVVSNVTGEPRSPNISPRRSSLRSSFPVEEFESILHSPRKKLKDLVESPPRSRP
eukprot:ANDGO_08241.mRNA.1 hypothetical protein